MFCDQCGNALVEGQPRCVRCGKSVLGYARRNRVQEHIRLMGVLWMAMGALNALGGVALLIVANTIFGRGPGWVGPGATGAPFLRPLLTALGIFVLAKAVAAFAAGWGLLQRESWARVLALVVGFLSLFNPPFGTALGIYTLWILLPANAEADYHSLRQAA